MTRKPVFWSLGVVIFEMIAGRVPFEVESVGDIIASILKTDSPPGSKPTSRNKRNEF